VYPKEGGGSMGNSNLRFVIMLLCIISPSLALSGELSLSVDQMDFCAAMKNRTPIGVADTFPSDISSIYCFTRVAGAKDTTGVIHAWFYGSVNVAEVELVVKSPLWRTWSRKRMLPGWQGDWRVDVIASDGSVIASKKFHLR
jgi:hypothetical protein